MEPLTLDPYERQLMTVFDSYDHDNLGSLDRDGLTQLCQTLQLEEQATDLITSLLNDQKHTRATFSEFRDALLALLGKMQKKPDNNTSPDREVSPKIYGNKKYGRRSRPKTEELDDILPSPTTTTITSSPVQRSNSQTEVSTKKRKTNFKLKRCTSLPGNNHLNFEPEFFCTEEMLREAWKKLGVGADGYLNQTELVLVCDAIGLDKLAKGIIKQLSDKLTYDYDHRISFQELLETLQQDETWSEVLCNTTKNDDMTTTQLFPDSLTFRFVTLGPDGDGTIDVDTLTEMWENVGITTPKDLINDLGFTGHKINISELVAVIEKEIKLEEEDRSVATSPHRALLYANLTLYQMEMRCLRNVIEQMNAEREKLKCDVNEANKRATLLAQEVDDNHTRLERNSLNQIKLIEQRHADIMREVIEQYGNEKDQLGVVNRRLEEKITKLEQEIVKLNHDLDVAKKYCLNIEKENHLLSKQVNELTDIRQNLNETINGLQNEKQRFVEMENQQIEPLLEKLGELQLENAQLRDRNDEMVAEIEKLSQTKTQMSTPSVFYSNTFEESMDENSILSEGVGLGAKRRSECSPTKDNMLFVEGSPRLGKVRKCKDQQPYPSNESGYENDADSSISVNEDEMQRLQAKILFLERLLAENNIPLPATDDSDGSSIALIQKVRNLEAILRNLNRTMGRMNQTADLETLRHLLSFSQNQSHAVDVATMTDDGDVMDCIDQYREENAELQRKCNELEQCIDLLRNEYERCEDYWQTKLDEERQMFEQEQQQSSEKLTDLITKVAEYEEQFANTQDNHLPTIEESYNLEKQFNDLEQEFDEYRAQAQCELAEKDAAIDQLKRQLDKATNEVAVQACDDLRVTQRMNALSQCVVETTNLFSADAAPAWDDNGDQSRKNYPWNGQDDADLPSTSSNSTLEKNPATPSRPKRTRKQHHNPLIYKKINQEKRDDTSGYYSKEGEKTMVLPIVTVNNLNARIHHLEQRCRQLQIILKQQHYYSEKSLQQCWQHHQNEKAELHCILRTNQDKLDHQLRVCNDQLDRLTKSDMLVKELYVENSYLMAKVQRLEQQCHMLAQCGSNCSV